MLQTRLIKFAVKSCKIANEIPSGPVGNNLASQLAKSGVSPCLNYAESENAESSRDFIHKLRISLKELRECLVCLRIIIEVILPDDPEEILQLQSECKELIAIFVSSINTVRKNQNML